jgi:SAM-dependent methyltransferase
MSHLLVNAEFRLLSVVAGELIAKEYKRQLDMDVCRFFNGDIEYREDVATGIRYFFPFTPGDDLFYDQLQKFGWYYQSEKEEYEFASRFTHDRSVLDIGCGSGRFADIAKAMSYTGLESNRNAAKKGRRKGLQITNMEIAEFCKSNAADFDVVTLFQVLEHVKEPIDFLVHAVKCVRPNGLLIVSVPSEDSFVGKAKNNILNMPPHHLTRWPDTALRNVGKILSLELLKLHHDYLDAIHVGWYSTVQSRKMLEGLLNSKKNKFFDDCSSDTFMRVSSQIFAKIICGAVAVGRRKLRGHTVTAIYQKAQY